MKLFGTPVFSVLWVWVAVSWLSQNFIQGAAAAESGCVGGGAADLVFLLDSSYSVWLPDFRRQLTFVQEVIDRIPIGPNKFRVAVVTYADYPQLQFHLDHYSDKPELQAAVGGIRQRGHFQTTTGDAIRFVRRNVFEVGSRSRPLGVNVARVAVIITDGRSDNRTAARIEAELAKQEGVLVFAVGVGKDVDLDELKEISSLPSEYFTFLVDRFADLARIRDLVATKTCKVAESAKNTNVFATYTTVARLAHTRSGLIETPFSKAPLITEISTQPAPNSNASSFTKAFITRVAVEDVASTKKSSVTATLTKLISPGMDSNSTMAKVTAFPSRALSTNSSFTRLGIARDGASRAASTSAVSNVTVTTRGPSTTTYNTTSASTTKPFSKNAMPPPENVILAPSTGIAGAERSRRVVDLQPSSKYGWSDGGLLMQSNETATPQKPHSVFPTNTPEGADDLITASSAFRGSEDSTENPRKITNGLETSCGFGLLDKILNGKSSSEGPEKAGEIAQEKGLAEEQQSPATVGSNGTSSGAEEHQHDHILSSQGVRNTTSSLVSLAQVTEGLNTTGTKAYLEETPTTTSRMRVTDGTAVRRSRLMGGTQRRKAVLTNGNYNWDSDEPRILTNGKGTSDEDDIDRGRNREGNGRLNYESGYQAKDYWRLDDRGLLVRYRMVSPGVYERETMPSYRTPRLEPNPGRPLIQRPESTQSSAVDDRQGLESRVHLNHELTDEENRENVSGAAHSGRITSRSRLITRTKGSRRGGYVRGPGTHGTTRYEPYAALERTNRRRPGHHRPQVSKNGYWRLNDLDKLVWHNNTQNSLLLSRSRATDILNTKSPHAQTVKTLNTGSFKNELDFQHTQSQLEINEAERLASTSGAHPTVNKANDVTPRLWFDDVTESLPKQMTSPVYEPSGSTRTPILSRPEIDNHNPKNGFWKYDLYGQNGVWIRYTRNVDVISTTDAPAMTYANLKPTSGTKGPSLADSDELSYGYWKRENGKPVWHEYRSPGIYRKVIDTDPLAVPKKIRIELPPGKVPGCRNCNLTRSSVFYGRGKVNESATSEELFVIRASDMVEKLLLNKTRPIALDSNKNGDLRQVIARYFEGLSANSSSSQFNTSANSRIGEISTLLDRIESKMSAVYQYDRSFLSSPDHGFGKISANSSPLDSVLRGMNGTGNGRGNWTYENMERLWIRRFNEMKREMGRSQRTRITTGMQRGLEENHGTSSISTTVSPRRDGTIWSAKATRSVSSPSANRRQVESRNPSGVPGDTASVHKKGGSGGQKTAPTKNNRKHPQGCVARRPLDVVFVVDPRARRRPYPKQLWQLAYEVVSGLRMDDDRVRVRFYPELEVVKAAAATNGSAQSGSVQTVIQKVAQKPFPELLRTASRLLAKSRMGVRRIGIYLTDGPSGTPRRELDRAVEEAKAAVAVELFAVGIGQETDPAELETIADSKLKGKHLYRLTKALESDIDEAAMKLTRALCGGR